MSDANEQTPKNDVLAETIRRLQPDYPDRELTREDARQMHENIVGVFSTLRRWAEKESEVAREQLSDE